MSEEKIEKESKKDFLEKWKSYCVIDREIRGINKYMIREIIEGMVKESFLIGYDMYNIKKVLLYYLNIEKLPKLENRILNDKLQLVLLGYHFIENSKRRYKAFMENVDDRPYWQYVAVLDLRTCEICRKLHSKVYRYDHPIWTEYFPPNHPGCRCMVRALNLNDIKERKIVVLKEFDRNELPIDREWACLPINMDWYNLYGKYLEEIEDLLEKYF